MVNGIKLFTAATLLLFSQLLMAAISSEIDRNRIEQGESFRLILKITANEANQVDLEPLHKDFQILGRSHQSSTTFQNGSLKSTTKLVLTLFPKRAGQLTIPALELEGEKSKEHSIEVVEVKQPSAVDGGVEFLSTLSDKTPIVQQPIIYQSSLVLGRKIYDAGIQEPQVTEGKALIEALGEQRQYEQELNGRRMLVIEQAWLITPQQSGTLKIQGARLSGQVPDGRPDPFRGFNTRAVRRIFVPAEDYEVEVQPIPAEFTGEHWLSAKEINLGSDFDRAIDSWKQGEPVTRTLTLEATGVKKEQLPELVLPEVPGLKQYATKPQIEQYYVDGELTLSLKLEVTVIPERGGKVTLPEIQLPWWNTEAKQQEAASIPAINLDVEADATATALTPNPPPQVQQSLSTTLPTQAPQITETSPVDNIDSQQVVVNESKISSWLMLVVGILIGVILSTVVFLLWRRYQPQQKVKKEELKPVNSVPNFKKLKASCLANNAQEARVELITWARHRYAGCNHLNDLSDIVSPEFKHEIEFLNRSCFASDNCSWDGKGLLKQVEAENNRVNRLTEQQNGLELLYKT
ncbi:BatD family protein [Neptuniibacter sp. QD48_11]|uniref:BatD family protein n=1 Tax=unclassified Neptuniibacter TaxID=2630693 RepID=UPI0039F50CB2